MAEPERSRRRPLVVSIASAADNEPHGSWGVLSDMTTSNAGVCDLDASTTTGPIHASKRSN